MARSSGLRASAAARQSAAAAWLACGTASSPRVAAAASWQLHGAYRAALSTGAKPEDKAPKQQLAQQAPKEEHEGRVAAPEPEMMTEQKAETDEVWTEVVHESTGQTYYWNQVRRDRRGRRPALRPVHAQMRERMRAPVTR
eukprot:364776-Chlamydomonas_euryale.AAC.3